MNYIESLSEYKGKLGKKYSKNISELRIEHHFECLKDRSIFHDIDQVRDWFIERRNVCEMKISRIGIKECEDWSIDVKTGNISHKTGEFFTIHGIRVDYDLREVGAGGWDQPILTQVGLDGGLLGILRQRFDGVPHYLIEAKAEPGNFGILQLSPTLQATFSNLKRAHEGSKPRFSSIFENPEGQGVKVLFDQWMSEDGGRLFLKRNKGMLVEVPENYVKEIPKGFIWLSMWQIKELLLENAWVNPHIRGIISSL